MEDLPYELNKPLTEDIDYNRCMNHCINLVARSTLKLFEIPKPKKDGTQKDVSMLDAAKAELRQLAEDIELEDLQIQLKEFEDSLTVDASNDSEDCVDIYTNILTDITEEIIAKF